MEKLKSILNILLLLSSFQLFASDAEKYASEESGLNKESIRLITECYDFRLNLDDKEKRSNIFERALTTQAERRDRLYFGRCPDCYDPERRYHPMSYDGGKDRNFMMSPSAIKARNIKAIHLEALERIKDSMRTEIAIIKAICQNELMPSSKKNLEVPSRLKAFEISYGTSLVGVDSPKDVFGLK